MNDTPPAQATGHPGSRLARPPRFRLNTIALKQIALAKLADITLLSAEFRGEQVVFEPWISLLVDTGDKALFLGAYRPSFDAEGDTSALPDLCWRRSEWLRDVDTAQVGNAEDRRAYLAGDTQIDSKIRFTRLDREPAFAALVDRSRATFARGVTLEPLRRPNSNWQRVVVDVADDLVAFRLDFSPLLTQSPTIETWAAQWLNTPPTLNATIEPDSDITLSYRRSLHELLAAI